MREDRARIAQAETICIRTTKIYDWCYKNGGLNFVLTDIALPADTSLVAGIETAITGLTSAEVDRRQAGGGIAIVTIRRQFTFDVTFVDATGTPVSVLIGGVAAASQSRTRFHDEFVQICAPEGTTVTSTITDAGARATLTAVNGAPAVSVDIFLCQSIQSEADVTVSLDINDFCVPDLCAPLERPYNCPPTQFYPPGCSPTDSRYTPPSSPS